MQLQTAYDYFCDEFENMLWRGLWHRHLQGRE